jgi:hypothetical protein
MKDMSRQPVSESYSFVCLSCGHGWEQTYRIEHHLEPDGRPYVCYYVDGHRVPSPLTGLTCADCEGHRVRLMRAGTVAALNAVGRAAP